MKKLTRFLRAKTKGQAFINIVKIMKIMIDRTENKTILK